MTPARAYVGVGANLGDARAACESAVAALGRLRGTRVAAVSSWWRSAPVDAAGPDYVNGVAALDTTLAPLALLDSLQAIEAAHGRERPYPNAPRTLDLDVLLFGSERMHSERLTLPHPRLHLRAFVLAPLAELAPDLVLPGLGSLAERLAAVRDQRIERLAP